MKMTSSWFSSLLLVALGLVTLGAVAIPWATRERGVQRVHHLSVGFACDARTDSTSAQSLIDELGAPVCLDAADHLDHLVLKHGQLRSTPSEDMFVVFVWPEVDRSALESFTRRNLDRHMVLYRGNRALLVAYVVRPLAYGYITVFVPDRASGHELLQRLWGD